MTTFTLTPPPPNRIEETKVWRDWIQALYTKLKGLSFIKFNELDFSGSNITSIETRHHNDLQNIQGGAPDDYQHLTTIELTDVQKIPAIEADLAEKEIDIVDLETSLADEEQSGFVSWGGTGDYWSVSTNQFTLLRPGTGYVHGTKVTWTAPQTVTTPTNATSLIGIDSTGTIQALNEDSLNSYKDNINLFLALYDGTQTTVTQEHHYYGAPPRVVAWNHEVMGTVFPIETSGALITRVTTGTGGVITDRELKIVGNDTIYDLMLTTTVPDSGGSAVTWNIYYTNASNKWIRSHNQADFPMSYNNAGTVTALGANQFGIFNLYVAKQDLNTSTPKYIAVMDSSTYVSSVLASAAITANTIASATNELLDLQMAHLGTIIVKNSGGGFIDTVNINKSTATGGSVSGGGGGTSDHALLTNLAWTLSGHTGTAHTIAGFDASGVAHAADATDFPTLNQNTTGSAAKWTTARTINLTSVDGTTDVTLVGATINAQTGTTYTFVLADAGKFCTFNNSSSVVVTVPPNSSVAFVTGTRIDISQIGAGQVALLGGVGVTIKSYLDKASLSNQYAKATLVKTGTDTWLLYGDLIAADPYWTSVSLLLHMDGTDASTTFTDQKSHTMTANGDAQIDTAQYKFGGASGLFDGTGDYVTTPDSADFEFGTGDFTIEGWMRFNAVPSSGAQMQLVQKGVPTSSNLSFATAVINTSGTTYLRFIASSDGTALSVFDSTSSISITTGTWYHFAFSRFSGTVYYFIDGTSKGGQTVSTNFFNGSGVLSIGVSSTAGAPFNGWLDDIRITKGIGRYTAGFAIPTVAYPNG